MAAHSDGTVELGTAASVDYADHERTYLGFLALIKWSSIAIILVLIFLFAFVF